MPAGTHVLMPAFVEAIETRARAIISGSSEDGDERRANRSVAQGRRGDCKEAEEEESEGGDPPKSRRPARRYLIAITPNG